MKKIFKIIGLDLVLILIYFDYTTDLISGFSSFSNGIVRSLKK